MRLSTRRSAAVVLALAAGAALWASHPPLSLGWLVYAVVPLLLAAMVVGRVSAVQAVALGATAGAAAFLPMLSWLITPAGFLAWALLALVQAAWFGAAAAVMQRFARSTWIVLVAPLVWTAMEAWRALVPLSGFAWGAFAYAHADGSPLLPWARVVGARGLAAVTVLVGVLVYLAVLRTRSSPRRARSVAVPVMAAALVVAAAVVASPAAPAPTGRSVDVLAVQGNDQERPRVLGAELDRRVAGRMLALTRRSVDGHGRPDLTIWPESSIDRDPWTDTGRDLLPFVRQAAAVTDGDLLLGVNLDGPRPRTFRNAVVLVGPDGSAQDRYVKLRYVPFGEYVPWRDVLEPLVPALRQVPRDGVAGPGPRTIRTSVVGVATVICFETLYGDVVRDNVLEADAGLVVAVTNDASFGRSSESDQHIAQSQLRAVETGRWVVHAALSGRSALIDPSGQVRERTGSFEAATIRSDIPVIAGRTPFLTVGDVAGTSARWSGLALVAVLLVLRRWPAAGRADDADGEESR